MSKVNQSQAALHKITGIWEYRNPIFTGIYRNPILITEIQLYYQVYHVCVNLDIYTVK